ncbi:scavenger mRNA decapping enzyme [Panus rudis PR-1116 ss-1]|nr:scavenger mRNA decapping enzyme [Panus rudis PR-1116 ss-1]
MLSETQLSLKDFVFERVLNEDPVSHSLTLLGTLPRSGSREQAIIRVEKTAITEDAIPTLLSDLSDVQLIENTDIYSWFFAWLERSPDKPDVKINVICPATEVHIRKYSTQQLFLVRETPELFERIVKPYIAAFPPSRVQWVYDILSGKSEAEKILYRDPSEESGFIILPDMKWDLTTVSSLYLVAIVLSKEIRCLRDLRKKHLSMLRSIRAVAHRIVEEKWGLSKGSLRLFIHYQPSYYHFHVHIVNANYIGTMGSTVGQAHLLDDIISLLELDPDVGPSIVERMTLTYGLGEQHGLFQQMKEAQEGLL